LAAFPVRGFPNPLPSKLVVRYGRGEIKAVAVAGFLLDAL
jgi:hypothetical protein